jgi:antitoxin CcdA
MGLLRPDTQVCKLLSIRDRPVSLESLKPRIAGFFLAMLVLSALIMRMYYAHQTCAYILLMSAKKAVNVSVQIELLDAARAEGINLSATLEAALAEQLRIRRRDRWRRENSAAIEAYNRDVDENGSFGDHARSF